MWFKYGLKAQKLLAQGIALGIMAISNAPCKVGCSKLKKHRDHFQAALSVLIRLLTRFSIRSSFFHRVMSLIFVLHKRSLTL